MSLHAHVADCLRRHAPEQSTGIVAVSGGPDSVALAHLCVGLLRDGKITRLILAHVNHQLRGDESDADETFVQGLPALWQTPEVTYRTTRIDIAALATKDGANLEATGRRERYRWLAQLAQTENAAWIATGHTADDQAETVLFRLLRGTGVLGLRGIAESRLVESTRLIRPLLSVRRQQVLDYLRDNQLKYRIDSSNRDLRFTRNRLRLELLPRLVQEYNPAIVEVLCRLAEQADELYEDIAARAAQLLRDTELPRAGNMLVFTADRLRNTDANLVREMFRLVWQREGWPMSAMDFERWNRLSEIVAGSCPMWEFPGKILARRVGKVMQIHVVASV